MAIYWLSPVVGFSRLSDRLPEISFRRTPRNARFRRDVAVWHMTLWSQNSFVGPLSTRGRLSVYSRWLGAGLSCTAILAADGAFSFCPVQIEVGGNCY
jgi:hypothetical protein